MKYITRKQAWTEIRDAFKNYTGEGVTRNGLCYAISCFTNYSSASRVSGKVLSAMGDDIRAVKPSRPFNGMHYWPRTEKGAKQRVRAINKILRTRV